MKTNKMVYIRNNNGAVVSILTAVDSETGDMNWSVSMCNKKDRFEKKIAMDLCTNKPFLSGTTTFSTKYVKLAKKNAPNFRSFEYLNTVAMSALMVASDRENRLPEWAMEMVSDEYYTLISGDMFGWDF